ncbi:MAG: hypothetical protein M5U14_15905 [Acidimicrobiia bacterium]|nr:hypothetical protein [Acidimicrobiia bacterium]
MSPETRFGATLVVSLALWFTSLRAILDGELDFATGCLRYAVALGVAWLAVAGIDRLVSGYVASAVDTTGTRPPAEVDAETPRRRAADRAPAMAHARTDGGGEEDGGEGEDPPEAA